MKEYSEFRNAYGRFGFRQQGLKALVEPDEHASSPRDDDNAGTLILFADKGADYGDAHEWEDMSQFHQWWREYSVIGGVCLALMERGDSTIACERVDTPEAFNVFGPRYRYLGVAYMTVEAMRREGMRDNDHAESVLRAEVEAFSQWRSGDVWGYTILDDDGCEYESLWGMYGMEYCEAAARVAVSAIASRLARDYCI